MTINLKYFISTFLVISFVLLNSCNDSSENNSTENDSSNNGNNNVVEFANAVEEFGQLSIAGNKLVDQNGNVVQLRGMSLFWSQWIGKYYNQNTIKWLVDDWQINVIRAAMAVENDGYLVNPAVEKAKVTAVIDAAIAEGIYVIVDWHDHEAENHLEEAKTFFAEIAEEYGSYPNLIYETYNEPLDVSWETVLKPYHEAVIAEIRNFDSDNIIVCGTRNWSQDVDDVIGNKIDDPNVAYSLHFYAATHKQELRNKATLAINNNIPLFVTEFGTTLATGDDLIDEPETITWWQFLDQHKISWCNWSLCDKDELSAALIPNASVNGNWTEAQITTSGTIVRNEIKAKNNSYD